MRRGGEGNTWWYLLRIEDNHRVKAAGAGSLEAGGKKIHIFVASP